ncbi:MAG: putative lipid II flippase FtsW [Phycisphaerae bacterium]|nr:putative lipid II flippase FtsW [Phycisphaerae bacterium]
MSRDRDVHPVHILPWVVFCLLGLAVLMIHSAAMSVDGPQLDAVSLLFGRPTLYAALALVVMWACSYLDVRRLYSRPGFTNPVAWLVVGASVLCVLALVPGLGRSVNGASRWLWLGPASWRLSFQPSELAKWVMIVALASWGARHSGIMRRFRHGLVPPLVLLGLVCALIVIEDLGTAVLIAAVGVVVLFAAGARLVHLLLLAPLGVAAVVGFIVTSPYRLRRITAFLDPFADPQGSGYHLIQSLLGIASGGPQGRGLGYQVQKFGFLPEDTTDFLFSVICGELGLAGAVLVIGLYLLLFWTGLSVIANCRHPFARLLSLGIVLTIALQAVMNIAVVTGAIPTKGIALPLLSYGGTGWVMTAAAVGLLMAVDRLNRLEERETTRDEVEADPRPVRMAVTAGFAT